MASSAACRERFQELASPPSLEVLTEIEVACRCSAVAVQLERYTCTGPTWQGCNRSPAPLPVLWKSEAAASPSPNIRPVQGVGAGRDRSNSCQRVCCAGRGTEELQRHFPGCVLPVAPNLAGPYQPTRQHASRCTGSLPSAWKAVIFLRPAGVRKTDENDCVLVSLTASNGISKLAQPSCLR